MKYEKSRGFTLIEFLVYSAIVVVVGVISVEFIINIYGGKAKAQSYFEIQENARLVMERLSQEIRGAQGINASSFGIDLAANPGAKLSLQMRDAALNPTEFDVSGNILRIKQGSAGPYGLTNNQVRVTSLIFRNFSSPNGKSKNIGIELTIEHANPSGLAEWQAGISLKSAVELKDR